MFEREHGSIAPLLTPASFSNSKRMLELGMDAVELLKAFGVDRSFSLSPQQVSLAALETVARIALKRKSWAEIDNTLRQLHNSPAGEHPQSGQLKHIEWLYRQAASQQAAKLHPRNIFAARDAAEWFASGYWRYTPQENTHAGQLLKSTLRRAGERYRPLRRVREYVQQFINPYLFSRRIATP